MKTVPLGVILVITFICGVTHGEEAPGTSKRFKALTFTPSPIEGTWKILDRDGANRKVEPYLSSLGWGESATGVVVSPVFTIRSKEIRMTLCGHDGPGGHRKKNFVVLVDAQTGETLRKTFAPLSDPLKPRSWDVRDLKGRQVRFQAHDRDTEGAFAWLGIGMVDASPSLKVDFRQGLPDKWKLPVQEQSIDTRIVAGGIPFQSLVAPNSMLPESGVTEFSCGFQADRLYFLGGTVHRGRPLQVFGHIEIQYRAAPAERYPLMYGYTLDGEDKRLSNSASIYLHPSGDPFQYYFAVRPRAEAIEVIRLEDSREHAGVPRITAITCETSAASENLLPLPDCKPGAEEATWVESHAIQPTSPKFDEIQERIRRAHKLVLEEGPQVLAFDRSKISDRTYEAASVFDVDNDGNKDIVCGAYWYEGPTFRQSHKITDVAPVGEYWDDFSDYPLDVNGDGFTDIITGAFFGGPLRWLENPKGGTSQWTVHPIEQVGAIETTRFWDVDGDGIVEICPNAAGNVVFFRLVVDQNGKGTGKFTKHVVKTGGCGHGLGFGDINGDGRGDFVVPDAWIESPEDPLADPWIWHDDGFRFGSASVPILVHDVSGDGKTDLIVGEAHGYGLDWYEQGVDHNGKRTWSRHQIDRGSSQYHDMLLSDIDNDGEVELITGKRYRAHNGHDPGSQDPVFLRYFDIDRGFFTCHTIDYGPAETASGAGIYFWVEDVDGNGWKDVVAPGKEGLYLFMNKGKYD